LPRIGAPFPDAIGALPDDANQRWCAGQLEARNGERPRPALVDPFAARIDRAEPERRRDVDALVAALKSELA
jgi:hypothetical protein